MKSMMKRLFCDPYPIEWIYVDKGATTISAAVSDTPSGRAIQRAMLSGMIVRHFDLNTMDYTVNTWWSRLIYRWFRYRVLDLTAFKADVRTAMRHNAYRHLEHLRQLNAAHKCIGDIYARMVETMPDELKGRE